MSGSSLRKLHPGQLFNVAGLLTLSRLPLAICFPFIAADRTAALIVILLAALTDALDGPVAKWTNKSSHMGGFADGWIDKIFNINVAWSLVIFNWLPMEYALLLFTREIFQIPLVPYYVIRYVRGPPPPNEPRWEGKLASVSLVVCMCAALLGFQWLCVISVAITALFGLWVGLFYLKREFEFLRLNR